MSYLFLLIYVTRKIFKQRSNSDEVKGPINISANFSIIVYCFVFLIKLATDIGRITVFISKSLTGKILFGMTCRLAYQQTMFSLHDLPILYVILPAKLLHLRVENINNCNLFQIFQAGFPKSCSSFQKFGHSPTRKKYPLLTAPPDFHPPPLPRPPACVPIK